MRALALTLIMFTALPALAEPDMAATPLGEGRPDSVTCRMPQLLPGSRLMGPRVCRRNAVWAEYHVQGLDIASDGFHMMAGEKYRSTHPMNCRAASPGGGGVTNMIQANMGMICD